MWQIFDMCHFLGNPHVKWGKTKTKWCGYWIERGVWRAIFSFAFQNCIQNLELKTLEREAPHASEKSLTEFPPSLAKTEASTLTEGHSG